MTDTTPDTAMPAEIAKLVERLRMPWPPDGSGDKVMLPVWVFELLDKAAATLAKKNMELNNLKKSMEELSLRLCDAEGALWRVFPNTHTIPSDHPLGKKTPDPFEGPGETYRAAYERMQSENEMLRKALEEIAAPAIFFLSRKDAIKMRDAARRALATKD